MKAQSTLKREIFLALKYTIPVMLGYIFLGIAFGLLFSNEGYGVLWAMAASVFVYAGSMQFVMISLITAGAGILQTIMMTIFVNGRHLFYGLSFIEKYKDMGKAKPYMIFSLTDETYSVLLSMENHPDLNQKRLMFLCSLFDQLYWITGSVLGSLVGQVITFDTTGIDFSMTALFVVIVVNQWMEQKDHKPALVGLFTSVICLLVLGPDNFLLPSLILISLILTGARKIWTTH